MEHVIGRWYQGELSQMLYWAQLLEGGGTIAELELEYSAVQSSFGCCTNIWFWNGW